jgi:citrate lyase subunit beta/citryl-CoA lyase
VTRPAARLARSYLYVPGHQPDRIVKARGAAADAIVIDLEDAVPPQERARAREVVANALREPAAAKQQIWVRVNAVATGLTGDDVEAVASPHLAGVRIAKVDSADDVRFVAARLAAAGCDARIQCLIESAAGLERISEVARADPAVSGVALGETDLAADLGVEVDDGLRYARSRCVVAARAAGLAPPVQSVFTDLADEDGLRRSTEAARALGFLGRSAIHPRQLAVINDVFTPDPARIAAAHELIEALERASAEGRSAFVLDDGRFVDPAVVERARRTLEIAARLGSGVAP